MKTVKKSKTESQGIKGLLIELQKAKKDGEKLFNLILQGKAASEAICNLVYQESLQELILFTLDHRKEVTASVSRLKSIEVRAKKTERDLELVLAWCNSNPELARQRGCTEFCVNGLMAGNRRISRSGYDLKHKESSTQRSH